MLPEERDAAYLEMTDLKCGLCGAELLPATSFCRQCGAEITAAGVQWGSETPTAIFGNLPDSATTQRLDPRPTSPDRGLRRTVDVSSAPRKRSKAVVGGFVALLIIVGILTTAVVVRMRNTNATADATALIYPGAQTAMDMTNTDGSRTIQLQAKEPLAKVENWYQSNLKLSKTVRLTSASVVMKKEKVTITLAEEDGTTNILIKQAP